MLDIRTPSDFKRYVMTAPLALVDFWAPWCAPCRLLAPTLERLQKKNPGLVIAKVNIDENPAMAQAFGVRAVPTLVLMQDGAVESTLVGVQPLERLQQALFKLG